jgi:hypothetical protein
VFQVFVVRLAFRSMSESLRDLQWRSAPLLAVEQSLLAEIPEPQARQSDTRYLLGFSPQDVTSLM